MMRKTQSPAHRQPRDLPLLQVLALAILIAGAAAESAYASSAASHNRQGNRLYAEGKYQDAEKAYLEAQGIDPGRPELLYNMGNALLKQKKYDSALQALHQAVGKGSRGVLGNAWYNLGNALFETGKYREAADAFVHTLKINPADREAKQNLELALRKLQEKKNQSSGGSGQDNPQQQKDDKQPQQNRASGQEQRQQKPDSSDPRQQGKKDEKPANPQSTRAGDRQQGLSRERALQILDALQNQELADQRKLLERQARRKATGKDW